MMIIDEKKTTPNDELFSAIEAILNENYEVQFTVTGNSMRPLLSHGRDSVIVERCDKSDLKKGDIVLLRAAEGRYLLHRIKVIKDELICTAGDANSFTDGFFPKDAVIAKVKKIVRKGKTHDMNEPSLQIYGKIWLSLYPIRPQVIKIAKKIKK